MQSAAFVLVLGLPKISLNWTDKTEGTVSQLSIKVVELTESNFQVCFAKAVLMNETNSYRKSRQNATKAWK